MKLPNLPKRKPKVKPTRASSKSKPTVRAPRFAEDLYRDMRDRRLLLPALALVVGIIAVPVALTAPKEPAPEPAAYVAPEGAEQVTPAVLTEQTIGVRDYKERLDDLKSKNPFAGDFAFPEGGGGGSGGELVPAEPVADATPTSDPGGTSAPATSTSSSPAAPADLPSDSGNDVVLILAPRIDALAGRAGPVDGRKHLEDVEIGDLLPDRRKAPIAMLMGVSDDLEFAHFVVSDDVTQTSGDGQCRPRANDCEFLRLRDGEKRSFTFGPDGDRFTIKVTDIREEIVDRRKVKGS